MFTARLRVYDLRRSRFPEAAIGRCQADLPELGSALEAVQERLLLAKESGDEGWYGTWARTVFNVDQDDPYITLPPSMARAIRFNVCRNPSPIQNQFYEFLQFGNGSQPSLTCQGAVIGCQHLSGFDRGSYPTMVDFTEGYTLRVRASDSNDIANNKRIFYAGTDTSDNVIYTQEGNQQFVGRFLTLATLFVDSPAALNTLTGLQKDITAGQVSFYAVNPTTGAETRILTMEPWEQVAGYRRYYLRGLPTSCCPVVEVDGEEVVQVEAIVKLNPTPLVADTDYLVIQCKEALIAEGKSLRYADVDGSEAKAISFESHRQAIRYLQGELAFHLGVDRPAVSFEPFGSARLANQGIGTIV